MKQQLLVAINELSKYYPPFELIDIQDVQLSDKVSFQEGVLYTPSIQHGLFYLTHYVNGQEIRVNRQFKTFGTMIDLSRNAVFTVDYMKEVIRKKALLGVNRIMLYIEDIYEVESEPYFGYMRGRYSKKEIHEIVDYATVFDIEIIPCIQTLGHMGQFLRWEHNSELKDQLTVLMTGTDRVYQFIESLIKTVRDMFKTNKIHVGLDETFGFGFGKYYKQFGFEEPYALFIKHLHKVNDICLKYSFDEVMIWSDMFFRISNPYDNYYDYVSDLPAGIETDIPENVQLVYWDYYNWKPEIVDGMVKKHLSIGRKMVMASGTWIWTKLTYDKTQTDKTALVHIDACLNNGIEDIYFTQWNDDGAPCNYETSYLGVYEMAIHSLTEEKVVHPNVFEFVTNSSYEDNLYFAKLNESPISPLPILWDDPLLGIYLNNEVARDANSLVETKEFFDNYLEQFPKSNNFDHEHIFKLAKLLRSKLSIRHQLVTRYQNKESLSPLIDEIKQAVEQTEELLQSYRKMWLSRYKAFGLDVIQSRLATLQYRYKELIQRINEYETGVITKIDELDEKVGPHQPFRMNHMNVAYSSIHVQSY